MVFAGLFAILIAVLFGPFLVKKIEEELEIFLFIMGLVSVSITSAWSGHLVKEALVEPVKITLAVFFAGLLFRVFQQPVARNVNKAAGVLGVKAFSFLVIFALGLLSSVITAIIAALVLVEIVSCLSLDRKNEIILVVLACFSIGLGAALTPVGEPLSTIAIAKLKGEPYHAGFFFLFSSLWVYIIPAMAAVGVLGAFILPSHGAGKEGLREEKREDLKQISLRTAKVYLFVMALIFLGRGFKPIVDAFIAHMPYQALYWLNMISAIVDNATLTAAEIGPQMSMLQIKSALMGLLIAGGMLIPGNIPNIISAGKLKIKSTEWAKFGAPLGLALMAVYFFLLH